MTRVTIELPDFASMDDDAVGRHFLASGRDGRWSRTTRALLARFGTTRLNLNEAWALTWEGWTCPCCERDKACIARPNEQGVLLCQLDLHHDHLTETAGVILKEGLDPDLPQEVRVQRGIARRMVYPLVERFEPTLLCADCNQADAKMKARLGSDVPRDFSFSSVEIARFILPEPNVPHTVDVEIGRQEWLRAQPDYESRLAFARLMATRLDAGLHDRQPALARLLVGDRSSRSVQRLADHHADPRARRSLFALEADLLHRSRAADGNASGVPKRRRALSPPTDADFASIEAALAESPNWILAGDAWECPICCRTKRAIARKSNKGRWHAMIQRLGGFWEESDPANRQWRSETHYAPIILAGRREYLACQDCRHIVTEAIKIVPGTDSDCFRLSDLRRLVGSPEPNRPHDVGQAAIRAAVIENEEWVAAVDDLRGHRDEACAISGEIDRLVAFASYPSDLARQKVYLDYCDRRPAFDDDAEDRFAWLVGEGRRLGAIDSRPLINPSSVL